MREDLARAEARVDQPVGPGFTALYILVTSITLFLATYTMTVAITETSTWLLPDTLGFALIADMAARWQAWVGGLVGAYIGYKISRLR